MKRTRIQRPHGSRSILGNAEVAARDGRHDQQPMRCTQWMRLRGMYPAAAALGILGGSPSGRRWRPPHGARLGSPATQTQAPAGTPRRRSAIGAGHKGSRTTAAIGTGSVMPFKVTDPHRGMHARQHVPDEHAYDFRDARLAGVGGLAEPRRFDDRRSEPVVVLFGGLARAVDACGRKLERSTANLFVQQVGARHRVDHAGQGGRRSSDRRPSS